MTPQEKAEELYRKYYNNYGYYGIPREAIKHSKQCALIAVDEILNSNPHIYIEIGGSDCRGDWSYKEAQTNKLYWQQVKQEIEKNYDPARKSN
jgi:hypothetical protein